MAIAQNAHSCSARSQRAFTLIELLVVLVIVAVLAALITNASTCTCRGGSGQAHLTLELQQIGGAIEDFKNVFGEYPPNLMANSIPASDVPLDVPTRQEGMLRMFRKAFPRSKEPDSLLLALTGKITDSETTTTLAEGMTASEAVFFWLGGFSQDPEYPLSGSGGPSFSDAEGNNDGVLDANDENLKSRDTQYEFAYRNLGPKTTQGIFDDRGLAQGGGRFVEYDDPRDHVRRRINFWQYSPGRSKVAIAYFDTSRHLPSEYYPAKHSLSSTNVGPLMMLPKEAHPDTPTTIDLQFVEQGKFQLLHTGLDDTWGDFSEIRSGVIIAPKGPFVGDLADTLANFIPGVLEDKQE